MGSKKDAYQGPLTIPQIVEGMNIAVGNAKRLLSDAELLFEAARYPTATSLATLSIEESGKLSILRGMVGMTDHVELKAEWKRYRDHRSKNGAWIILDLFSKGARHLHEFSETLDRDAEHTSMLDSIKQIGFYTDSYKQGNWSEPDKIIKRDLAESLIKIAGILVRKRQISVREMELWQEIVVPHKGTLEMPHATLHWATRLYEEGLSDIPPETHSKFIFGEPGSGYWEPRPKKAN